MQRFDGVGRRTKLIVGNRVDGFTDFTVDHASGGWGTLQVGKAGPWIIKQL